MRSERRRHNSHRQPNQRGKTMIDYERMNELLDLRDDLRQILGSRHHPDRALRRLGRASMTTADTLPHRRAAVAEMQRRYRFATGRTCIQDAIRSLTDELGDAPAPSTPPRKKIAPRAKQPSKDGVTDGGHDR